MSNRLSRFAEGVMEASWLLALIVAPLFFNIYSSRVFEPDKITLVRSLAGIALAAWLVKLIAEDGLRHWNWRAFWRIPLVVPVLAFVVVYSLATALSITSPVSLFGSYQRLQGTYSTFSYLVLFAVIAGNLRRQEQVERIITTVIVTSLPISLYAILQRYQLDPLPWGGDTVSRVTGHMGNAIFIGAYLIMAATVNLGRVVTSLRAIMKEPEQTPVNVLRAAFYIFILVVNAVALFFTVSRGPQLGLMAGLFFFFILLALHYRVRWLVLSTMGLGVVAAAFIITINLPNGPLEPLKQQVPGLARLGDMLNEIEGGSGTGQVRVLIWEGVVDMMTSGKTLTFPDGSPDPWASLRPWLGYGPEALYVAFNPFYPPELGQLEARNASPDRSHNETFDAIAFSGLIGLVVYLVMFVAVFYYALKWLGMITTPARRNIFLLMVLGAGALGAYGFVAWQGPALFGVGLPFGMLLGLIGFLTLYALIPTNTEAPRLESWKAVALIGLFAGMVAHFTEIHFGIAIVSTRTHFWVYTGVMLAVGYAMTQGATTTAPAAPAEAEAPATPARRRPKATSAKFAPTYTGVDSVWWHIAASAGVVTMVLITLGYNFITNPFRKTETFTILSESFTLLPGPQRESLWVLWLILGTALVGSFLAFAEENRLTTRPWNWGNWAATLGIALAASALYWVLQASRLAAVARVTPQSIEQLLGSVENVAGTLSQYYVVIFLFGLVWAWTLTAHLPVAARTRFNSAPVAWVGYLGLPIAALFAAVNLNLQVIQADIIYKTAVQFDDQGQPQVAIPLFNRVLQLAPAQDFYYLFLGRAYLNASNQVQTAEERDQIFATAESRLKDARGLNPLNTDHTANLARLNRQWAVVSPTPEQQQEKARLADEYYAVATQLSPQNAGIWNEWGALKYQLLNDFAGAEEKLKHSAELDDTFDQTYQYLGDLYAWQANRETDPAARQGYFDQSIAAYQSGVERAKVRGSAMLNIRLGLATVYVTTNQIQPAIQEYEEIARLNAGANQWQVLRALAELYRQNGDLDQARNYGQQALAAAPEANKPDMQSWLNAVFPGEVFSPTP